MGRTEDGDLVIPKYLLALLGAGGMMLGALGGLVSSWVSVSNTIVEMQKDIASLQSADEASIHQREGFDTRLRAMAETVYDRMQERAGSVDGRLVAIERELAETQVRLEYLRQGQMPDFTVPPPRREGAPR